MPYWINRRQLFWMAGAALAAAPRSTHWALLSDTHIPADTQDTYRGFRPFENLKKIIPDVLAAKPEAVLINGDLARLEGRTADYETLKNLLEPVRMPLCLSLGNHDDRKNFRAVFAPQEKPLVANKHISVIDRPPVRLIVLDSLMLVNQVPGLLGKGQRTWLERYLQSSDDTPTLIFVHHTLDDTDGSLLDADRFFRIVTPVRKVKAILYGHSHKYNYDVVDGVHLVNLPAVGYNFADREPVGWVDAVFTAQGGEFRLRAIGGNTAQDGKPVSLQWRT